MKHRGLGAGLAALWLVLTGSVGLAATAGGGEVIAVQDLTLTVPDGWRLKQDAKDEGTIILGFEKGTQYFTLYVRQATDLDMRTIFMTNGAQIVRDVRVEEINGRPWSLLETSKRFAAHSKTYFVASFLTALNGYSYYGFARDESSAAAQATVADFLGGIR